MNGVIEGLGAIGVVPVVELPNPGVAAPLADALLKAGIGCVEITFRTQGAPEAISEIARRFPEMLVGAGTVLTVTQADEARDAGARFVVTPGFGAAVVDRCLANGIPTIPGVCTPTEILMALEVGLDTVKFFPAEAAGGPSYLRALRGPFSNVAFLPTGGIDEANLAAYLSVPGVIACGGSWFVRKEWLAAREFGAVTEAASQAAAVVARCRRAGA